MTQAQGSGIYCGTPVILSRGEGDHVIPDALGRFKGQLIFRCICRACNKKLGKCEEQLLRCAPEAFLRRIVQPTVRRSKRGKAWVGASGMPSPVFTIDHGDHRELVDASTAEAHNAQPIDQLVVVDTEKGEQYIRLVPEMTAAQLRARILAVAPTPRGNLYLHCDDGVRQCYTTLLKEVFPNSQLTERDGQDAGVHQVRGRASFTFHNDYWRAIAKIGFHYYLLNNRRGVLGDEPEFAAIRRFIIEGGAHEPFFSDSAAHFRLPFGELPDGGAILPANWAHVLAIDESGQAAVAMVCLFMGPERLAPIRHFNLGRFNTPATEGIPPCAHAYLHDAEPDQSQYAGHVFTLTVSRLR
jgi:hypothetical protein